MHNLQATATSSTTEVQALDSRIKTLESQNRDAIAMLEAKVAAHDRLANELSEQHQKSVELRKQLSALEEKNQKHESAASNVKFRETNLQQEIEALRKNNEWYTTELKTRSDDHGKYRKEKNALVAKLQREIADASEDLDTLRRSEALLRQHIDELKNTAEEDRTRIEHLENAASQNEANHRIEIDSARRLASLHQANAESARRRLQEVQADLERTYNNASDEVSQLQADVELERNRAAEAEAQVAQLDSIIENLRSEASDLRSSVRPPATPRHGMNGNFGTPGRAGSPAVFSPGGSNLKADATRTQLLIENNDLKKELRRAREKNEQQTTIVNDMLQELERRYPELDELRRENDSVVEQRNDLSRLLEDAVSERESASKSARKAAGDLEGVKNQCKLLQHEVRDMTIQLRSLLWRRQADEEGLDSLPPDQRQFVLDAVDNEVPDHALSGDSDTHNLITKHLVLYKSVAELQTQNAELLRTIRRLGDGHEAQEARNKLEQHEKDQEELVKLRALIADKEEQIASLNVRSRTLKTERDMYSRMVTSGRSQASSGPQTVEAFAQSVPAGSNPLQPEDISHSKDSSGYSKLIKDLQSHVDLLKEESATDRSTSKSQIDGLTKENSQLQSEKSRLENLLRRENERYNRLEGTVSLLQQEKGTLQERYNSAHASVSQRDDRLARVEQDLAEAGTRIQGLESELVHLKASQEVAQSIEARLKERNQELMDERDRLSRMVTEVQSLRNEYELSTANTRRDLQNRVETLDADLHKAQRKLEDEVADHKRTTQQRDYERTEAQRRIDDLITARNNAEVKTAAADSVRQQLEQRTKDLQTQLQSAEERLESLQPSASRTMGSTGEEDGDQTDRDEELATQVSDLQRKLERKQEDLESVNAQIEGFQNIAQDAEERLQTFVEAHERLQEDLNLAQQEKDSIIRDLQQRVEDISSELATSTTELTELRGQHEQESLQFSQEKDALEAEISRLKNDVNDYKEEAAAQSEFVKTQADIAARAQQDYEGELSKHGKTMEKLRELRDAHDQLKSEISQFKAQADAARTTLEQSQEHWKTTQGRYDDQVEEAKRRHEDLKQYNKTLLKQFDDYKAQIDSLKHDRVTVAAGDAGTADHGSSNMEDIETYLRREKEILEVQLNLKDQEAKRLEQQLTHAQTLVDQAREKLITEQSKSQTSQSSTSIQDLHERVQELNVYRESNMTLRNDNIRLQSQVTENSKVLEDLRGELEPLQSRVSELEGELELNVGHLKAVEEDRDRWQKRHQDVLQRYDRIDPKELEDLKQQIEDLKTERDQALEQVTSLTEKIQTLEATQETAIAEARAFETNKARQGFNRVHNEKMKAKGAEIEGLTNERNELQSQLTSIQQQLAQSQEKLEVAQSEAAQAGQQATTLQQQLEQARTELEAAQHELQTAKTADSAAPIQPGANASTDVTMSEDGQVDEGAAKASAEQVQRLTAERDEAKRQVLMAQSRVNDADSKAAKLAIQYSLLQDRTNGLDQEVVSPIRSCLTENILTEARRTKAIVFLNLRMSCQRYNLRPLRRSQHKPWPWRQLAPQTRTKCGSCKKNLLLRGTR